MADLLEDFLAFIFSTGEDVTRRTAQPMEYLTCNQCGRVLEDGEEYLEKNGEATCLDCRN